MGVFPLPQGKIEYTFCEPSIGEAPVFVLLHEGLGSCTMWRDFPEELAQTTGCGVLAYSRFGYGSSAPASLPRNLKYMNVEGEDVLPLVLEAAGIQRFFLMGHSDGASIAAIYSGHHDDPLNCGIILMAPHFFTEPEGLASIERARHAYEATDLRARLSRYHEDVDNAFRGWNDAWLDPKFKTWNIERYLPDISVPVLVIQGEDDEYGTEKQPDAAKARCKGPVEVQMLAACGHSPHRDQREVVLSSVASFVNRFSGPPKPEGPG